MRWQIWCMDGDLHMNLHMTRPLLGSIEKGAILTFSTWWRNQLWRIISDFHLSLWMQQSLLVFQAGKWFLLIEAFNGMSPSARKWSPCPCRGANWQLCGTLLYYVSLLFGCWHSWAMIITENKILMAKIILLTLLMMIRRNVYDDVDNSDYAGDAEILYKCCYTAMVTNCKCGHHRVLPRRY